MKSVTKKLQLLQLTRNKTETVIGKGNVQGIMRHKQALMDIVGEADSLKREVEQAKLSNDESAEDVAKWALEIEEQIEAVDDEINNISKHLAEIEQNEEREHAQKEEEKTARERDEQLKFERAKLELQKEFNQNAGPTEKVTTQKDHVKLPTLCITKFNGTPEQWLSFWKKFEVEIDEANIAPVTKFAYLKELVEPKVREEIDGLPFSADGYEKAKTILKNEYGKESEIVHAYVRNIAALPSITGSQPQKIHQFYKTLMYNVQSLDTLGKLQEVKGNVRSVIEKLKGIKADLVRGEGNWQDWDFLQLLEALRKWKDINPIESNEKINEKPPQYRARNFQTQEHAQGCVYCDETTHKTINCDKVITVADRKKQLSMKRLCFNCTGSRHRAADCRSRSSCQKCQRKHHTSICDQNGQKLMTVTTDGTKLVCHPVVVINVNGIKCRALLDTGAGSSYASSALIDLLQIEPRRTEIRRIEMIIGSVTKKTQIYGLQISNMKGDFILEAEVTKIDRSELLSLANPKYKETIARYPHLKGVKMEDNDEKPMLPVHIVLGTNEYARIKTASIPRVGKPGEPVAEETRFGWTVMSPGDEVDMSKVFQTQTSVSDYEGLCRLDVLGLEDSPTGDQHIVYEEFREQLKRSPDGWYETGLPWKGNHPPLPDNKYGSLRRLTNLVRKLEKTKMLESYNDVIQDQLKSGVVERVVHAATKQEFYIPHKPVVRDTAETTKLRIVYDASAKAHEKAPSLNDCLEIGPPLQNQLWKVLVRGRFYAVAIAGDLKKAFLQVRIKEEDRDALRFHWLEDLKSKRVETLRFTRALFGLGPSPFLLGGVIQQHLGSHREMDPTSVAEIEKGLYVDDLISGGQTVEEAIKIKNSATELFAKAKFELHKWHSNDETLESTQVVSGGDAAPTYAKMQLGVPEGGESRLLGLTWSKEGDTIGVNFPTEIAQPTKRGILGKVAKIYDPLGLVSPLTLVGKMMYRDACEARVAWDADLPNDLTNKWTKWERRLPSRVTAPRSLIKFREPIQKIDLHAFGDASGKGVAAAVYAVVTQPSGVNQGLVAAKSRLVKQGLTIPRLELVSGHMAANLVQNVREALDGFPLSRVYCWLDSSVALHWIRGSGEYKQFVHNRVLKIQEKDYIHWRHVGTLDNPADLGSRGSDVSETREQWWRGPDWLSHPQNWPTDIVTNDNQETLAETKPVKQLFKVAITEEEDELDKLLGKWSLWKGLRISGWMSRFVHNASNPKETRNEGPLTTAEIEAQTILWEKRIQERSRETSKFEEDREKLNLQPNEEGILQCRGRIQGDYPVYLPDSSLYAEKKAQQAHESTLHGGVGLTMAKIRETHWIPRLRRLVRRVIKRCHGCKRYQATALASPPPGKLPKDRTEGTSPFQVVGVDYAGPIKFRKSGKQEGKAYIVLYACSLTRALHLELTKTMETGEFLATFKRLIARKGRPEKVYSDNGKTFVAAAKWLNQVMNDERFNDFLAKMSIKWQFNLSRAPWWGGQFERMVGLVKRALYKSIGNGYLTWTELQDVLLDVEVALNNRPLSYVEDDIQLPLLTPNALQFGRPNLLPEREDRHINESDLRKRAKYLRRCKDVLWGRWSSEYLKGLRERHNLQHNTKQLALDTGDVVVIKADERNRGKWKLGIVEKLVPGTDGVVRAVRLRAGRSYLQRPIQHLYPLELSCDRTVTPPPTSLNTDAPVFKPKRAAAQVGRERIREIANLENNGTII